MFLIALMLVSSGNGLSLQTYAWETDAVSDDGVMPASETNTVETPAAAESSNGQPSGQANAPETAIQTSAPETSVQTSAIETESQTVAQKTQTQAETVQDTETSAGTETETQAQSASDTSAAVDENTQSSETETKPKMPSPLYSVLGRL